jgi:hypothetical protein
METGNRKKRFERGTRSGSSLCGHERRLIPHPKTSDWAGVGGGGDQGDDSLAFVEKKEKKTGKKKKKNNLKNGG